MKLIQSIDVYAPQHLGKKDVLTINDKIVILGICAIDESRGIEIVGRRETVEIDFGTDARKRRHTPTERILEIERDRDDKGGAKAAFLVHRSGV